MLTLSCTARRIGDLESRTEEYELAYLVNGGVQHTIQVKYQAARAFEINGALDSGVEAARAAIAEADPSLAQKPSHESLAKFTWRMMQSVKYEEGAAKTDGMEL